ncbi:MAG: ketoacyl-ACP synthase III [Candidatus Omnitrophica bacterium]|nr:ketoacyl-ACP synthase III [Candidatus Omnitrophota bacterium]
MSVHRDPIGIIGIGHSTPERRLTNADLERMVDTSDEWIRTRTGIRERRIAEPGTGTSHWASRAARDALKSAGKSAEEIDLIVVGTTTPDMPIPSCSCLVQELIGARRAVCFDLAAACAGFLFSLATAEQYLRNGFFKTALVIGADELSPFVDWKERSTCVLFGDAAGACVLGAVKGRGIIDQDMGSDGQASRLIMIPSGGSASPASAQTVANGGHYLKMNGAEVFKLAVRGMTGSVNKLLERNNLQAEDIACIIPHQANMRIIDAVASRLGVPIDRLFVNLDRYGNTSAASIAVALSEASAAGRIRRGDKVILTTFGAGLVWGSTLLEWE